jgi:hypothetical protein
MKFTLACDAHSEGWLALAISSTYNVILVGQVVEGWRYRGGRKKGRGAHNKLMNLHANAMGGLHSLVDFFI